MIPIVPPPLPLPIIPIVTPPPLPPPTPILPQIRQVAQFVQARFPFMAECQILVVQLANSDHLLEASFMAECHILVVQLASSDQLPTIIAYFLDRLLFNHYVHAVLKSYYSTVHFKSSKLFNDYIFEKSMTLINFM